MGHSLNRTSFRINQNLVVDDKTFNPGYILVSDIYGNASWQNPNQYITNEEPLDHFIGELYGGGIVVAVWREQREVLYETCLIASVKDYGEPFQDSQNFKFKWTNNTLSIGTASRYNAFGASNSLAIIASDTSGVGAAAKCLAYINEDLYGLGIYGDWYLPSTFELNCLANNAAIVNRVISKYATDKVINLVQSPSGALQQMSLLSNTVANEFLGYWTSTEYNTGSAHYLNMGVAGGVRFATASKSSLMNVRPFRQDVKRWNGLTWVQDRNKTGKILIAYDQPAPIYASQMIANITATEVSLGNTVDVITSYSSLPADLSQYDHIWDVNVNYPTNTGQTLLVPTGTAAKYITYLQQGGGIFMLGENSSFLVRNNDLVSFITNLGGGSIQISADAINNTLNMESEFLIANNRNTVTFAAIGRFSSIGTGNTITRNPIDSSTGHAVIWKTGSLSSAPKGALVVVLDFNFLSTNYTSGYSQEFMANLSQILNKS